MWMNISSPSETNMAKLIRWSGMYYHENERLGHVNGAGANMTDFGAMTGLRFFFDSGSVATGIFKLYGVAK